MNDTGNYTGRRMRGAMLVAMLAAVTSAFAQKATTELALERLVHENGFNKAVVRVKNLSLRAIEAARIDCAFMSGGRALATDAVIVKNIAAGETAFATVMSSAPHADDARCRVSSTR